MKKIIEIEAVAASLPARSKLISWAEFIELTDMHPSRLGELIELGWIEPRRTQDDKLLFRVLDVYRIRKLERICQDFEIPSLGGTIIVDLLDRIEYLEQKVREMERLLRL